MGNAQESRGLYSLREIYYEVSAHGDCCIELDWTDFTGINSDKVWATAEYTEMINENVVFRTREHGWTKPLEFTRLVRTTKLIPRVMPSRQKAKTYNNISIE